jgi:spermidine dehydrogenase
VCRSNSKNCKWEISDSLTTNNQGEKPMSKIARRDFVNGTLIAAGASMLPIGATSQAVLAALDPQYYPPALTGLRGDNKESYTHAHSKALAGKSHSGSTIQLKEEYDLVVVGGGISGLSAAFFYQQQHGKDKKVLILDSHADFGGQCVRNEHTIGDNTRLIFGGSQTIVSPHARKYWKYWWKYWGRGSIGVSP